MFPKLYKSNETDFNHNGLGLLSGAIKAVATEELNGLFELQIEYDSEGFLVNEIKEEMIIKAKANDKQDEQLFRIYSITKNHENDNLIIDAQHITYDLANDFVEEMVAKNISKKQVMEKILASSVGDSKNRFTMTSTNTTTLSSTSLYRSNPLQMVAGMQGSVLQIWGGQIERDNFRLVMHDRRGHDDGVLVTYKKNLTGLEAVFDISNVTTRIYPFVFDEENNRLITINGKYLDSPYINDYEVIRTLPIDFGDKFENAEDATPAKLLNVAKNWFKETNNDRAKVEMEVKFQPLWETEEYKNFAPLELVEMGDTITVKHSKLNVQATAIVNRIEYDCIARKNIAVDVGSVKARFSDSIKKIDEVAEKVVQAESKATQAMISANGKNTNFHGPDEPRNPKTGDLWFKEVDGEYTGTWQFDGIQWQLIVDPESQYAKELAEEAKNNAQQAVDRADQATADAQQALDKAQVGFDKAQDALTAVTGVDEKAQQALDTAQISFDKAQDALGEIGNVSSIANGAFDKANQAFDNVDALSVVVGENTGEISTIKQTQAGIQAQVNDNKGHITTLTIINEGLQATVADNENSISQLTQTAGEISTRIDNMSFSTRNLILKSDFTDANNYNFWVPVGDLYFNENSPFTYEGFNKQFLRVVVPSAEVGSNRRIRSQYTVKMDMGVEYTFSFIGTTSDWLDDDFTHTSYYRKSTSTYQRILKLNKKQIGTAVIGGFNKPIYQYWVTFTNTFEDAEGLYSFFIGTKQLRESGAYFVVTEPMLTQGNQVVPWQPAPEDNDYKFSQIYQTIDGIETAVGKKVDNTEYESYKVQTAENIASKVSQKDYDANNNIINNKFSVINQDVNSIATRVQSNEDNYSTLTQTVDGLQTTVNTKASKSEVTQLANVINSRVSGVEGSVSEVTQTANRLTQRIDDLPYEGRNLVRFTAPDAQNASEWVTIGAYTRDVTAVDVGGEQWFRMRTDAVEQGQNPRFRSKYNLRLTTGQTYTVRWLAVYSGWFSFDAYGGVYNDSGFICQRFNDATRKLIGQVDYSGSIRNVYEYTYTFTFNDAESDERMYAIFLGATYTRSTAGNTFALYKEIKLEKGDKATDYSVAPEDYDYKFSEIIQTVDSVTQRVGDAEGNITVLQQTSSSFATRIDDVEGNYSRLTQTVDGFQTEVNKKVDQTTYNSKITQIDNALQSTITETTADGRYATKTALTATADSLTSEINKKVDNTTYTSKISQLEDNINLRVKEGETITQINLDAQTGSVLIDGRALILNGDTTVNGTFKVKDANIESVSGAKVNFGILDGNKASIRNINADYINNGSIDTKWVNVDNDRIVIDKNGMKITRPDGVDYMINGLVKSEFAIAEYDPPMMDVMKVGGNSLYWAFEPSIHELSFIHAQFGTRDGRSDTDWGDGSKFNDIRNPDYRYSVRYQRYRFMHSARYLKFSYQIAVNDRVGKHAVDFFEVGTAPSGATEINTRVIYEKGDQGTKIITIDLGKPTYKNRAFDFRIGWNKSWNTATEAVRFRLPYRYQTDDI